MSRCKTTKIIQNNTYVVNADLAGASACERVYPEVRQILCRWHVDKYVYIYIAVFKNNLISK